MGAPRWRVAIVDDHPRSQSELRDAIRAAGGVVVATFGTSLDAPAVIARTRPDAAIFAVGLADGDGVAAAAAVMAASPCPIVLLTGHRGEELIRRATRAGVMGYLLKPLRAEELAPALDLAIARFAEIRELRARLAARKLIERAKGLLMAREGLTEDEAFRALRRAAMDRRRSIAEIAEAVLVAGSTGRETIAG